MHSPCERCGTVPGGLVSIETASEWLGALAAQLECTDVRRVVLAAMTVTNGQANPQSVKDALLESVPDGMVPIETVSRWLGAFGAMRPGTRAAAVRDATALTDGLIIPPLVGEAWAQSKGACPHCPCKRADSEHPCPGGAKDMCWCCELCQRECAGL